MKEFTVQIKFDVDRFTAAVAELLTGFADLAERVVLFMRGTAEDSFVEYCGIARSDIKKIKFENGDAVAYLYNGRKIPLELDRRVNGVNGASEGCDRPTQERQYSARWGW